MLKMAALMAEAGVLISWAMPATTWPRLAIFSERTRWASACLRSSRAFGKVLGPEADLLLEGAVQLLDLPLVGLYLADHLVSALSLNCIIGARCPRKPSPKTPSG